jgi:hypothetical protein
MKDKYARERNLDYQKIGSFLRQLATSELSLDERVEALIADGMTRSQAQRTGRFLEACYKSLKSLDTLGLSRHEADKRAVELLEEVIELGLEAREQGIIRKAISTIYMKYSTVQRYFPHCPVEGSYDSVGYGHLSLRGAVPTKCSSCEHVFEAQCARVSGSLIDLDHGPCPIEGSSRPASYEIKGIWTFVPTKCSTCQYLGLSIIGKLVCKYDSERWGDFPRGMDWGDWEPGEEVGMHNRRQQAWS